MWTKRNNSACAQIENIADGTKMITIHAKPKESGTFLPLYYTEHQFKLLFALYAYVIVQPIGRAVVYKDASSSKYTVRPLPPSGSERNNYLLPIDQCNNRLRPEILDSIVGVTIPSLEGLGVVAPFADFFRPQYESAEVDEVVKPWLDDVCQDQERWVQEVKGAFTGWCRKGGCLPSYGMQADIVEIVTGAGTV